MRGKSIARVAVFRPINREFEYLVPHSLQGEVVRGSLCRVPFHNGKARGLVLELGSQGSYSGKLEEIESLVYPEPLPSSLLSLGSWLSSVSLASLGTIFAAMTPSSFTAKVQRSELFELSERFETVRDKIRDLRKRAPKQREILEYMLTVDKPVSRTEVLSQVDCSRSPFRSLIQKGFIKKYSKGHRLTKERRPLSQSRYGKSNVKLPREFELVPVYGNSCSRFSSYKTLIDEGLQGGSVLVLGSSVFRVGEINRWLEEEKFLVDPFYSSLPGGELAHSWRRAISGEASIVTGVRKAVFTPLTDLKAIIVENEGHDFYQPSGQRPRFDVVRIAQKRAEIEDIPLILGDSVPSLRTFFQLKRSKKTIPDFDSDRDTVSYSPVCLIDSSSLKSTEALAPELEEEIKTEYSLDNCSVLIGQKKGHHRAVICKNCESVLTCKRCKVPLVFEEKGGYCRCMYCGKRMSIPVCNDCGSDRFRFIGGGIEKIAARVRDILPRADVVKVSGESFTPEEFLSVVDRVNGGDIDVLIGTELVGSFFFNSRVKMIGLVDVDSKLNRPDHRSSELVLIGAFRAMDQVDPEGRVVIQTSRPDHDMWKDVVNHRWRIFYSRELQTRRSMQYPPYARLIRVIALGGKRQTVEERCNDLKQELIERVSGEEIIAILGPAPLYPPKIREKFRYSLLIKTGDEGKVFSYLKQITEEGFDVDFLTEVNY